jgi:small subunit ribosomal protein S17e
MLNRLKILTRTPPQLVVERREMRKLKLNLEAYWKVAFALSTRSVDLGKVKTEQIKRLGKELIERFPEKFSNNFDENKHAVTELTKGTTPRIRNQIAGYITSQCAPEEETETPSEEAAEETTA